MQYIVFFVCIRFDWTLPHSSLVVRARWRQLQSKHFSAKSTIKAFPSRPPLSVWPTVSPFPEVLQHQCRSCAERSQEIIVISYYFNFKKKFQFVIGSINLKILHYPNYNSLKRNNWLGNDHLIEFHLIEIVIFHLIESFN
jgi:hypothetical protein